MDRAKIRNETRRLALRALRKRFSSNKAMAEALGEDFSPSFLSQLLNGHRGIGDELASKIEHRLRLANGFIDQRLPADDTSAAAHDLPPSTHLPARPDLIEIPLISLKLSAGKPGFEIASQETSKHPIFFQREWCSSHGYRPEALFALHVLGQSMEPSLWDGDLVIINAAHSMPVDGEVFALNHEGTLLIRRMKRDAGQWLAVSDNPDQRRHSPKHCTPDVKILGKVIFRQGTKI